MTLLWFEYISKFTEVINYFFISYFFCLQKVKLKVIAQASPTNIKCNESFISYKFKKEGRLSEHLKAKLTLEKKNSHCLLNELKSRDVFDFFDHARWMS